jgi:hypothetical protein
MQQAIGAVLGYLVVATYLLSVIAFFCKKIIRRHADRWKAHGHLKDAIRFPIRHHRKFGIACILLLALHFANQFGWYGLEASGLVAAAFLVVQAGSGIYGSVTKRTGKGWLSFHRLVAVLLPIAMLVHIL